MGFFATNAKLDSFSKSLSGISIELLHKHQCTACPLNKEQGLNHPHMEPHGSTSPLAYLIGEAPGEVEDQKGIPFVGPAGRLLHAHIPAQYEDKLRFNNCVRTRPQNNREPTQIELECCRPSIIKDIEQTRPRAVFGFGNVPLQWTLKQSGITKWNGRKVPVRIGTHLCWYFPMLHPSYVLRSQNQFNGREIEFVFDLDLKHAFAELDNLPEPVIHTPEDAFEGVEITTNAKHAIDFIQSLYDEKLVGIDYETNCIRPYATDAKILTVALAGKDQALAFPLRHRETEWSDEELKIVNKTFKQFLREALCRKVAHNLAFEQEWSAFFYGDDVLRAQPWGDSMAQAYILDERMGAHSLDFLCTQYFGLSIKDLSNVDRAKLDEEPLEDVLRYNALDAKYHRLLYIKQSKRLKQEGLSKVYQQHLRRIPTMVLTQAKGIPVDQTIVSKLHTKYAGRLDKIEAEIADLKIAKDFKHSTGREFRPSALKDVSSVLSIEGSLNESALAKIKHPLARMVVRWRKTNKLLSTYIKPLMPGSPDLWPDGLLHPITGTTKTRTSRTSADSPNYQNFPKRNAFAKEVRSQIKSYNEHKIVSFDYAGIQARNVAMESKDKALVKSFWDRSDIHREWMERIAKAYPKWVDGGLAALQDKDIAKKYRYDAKSYFVFASFFGAGAKTVASGLGIPENVAFGLREEFWDIFSGVLAWHKNLAKSYQQLGYVSSLAGFRRHAPVSHNELINCGIQADETAIVCNAMDRLSEMGEPKYQANMMIHDDLTFVWEKHEIDKNAEVVIDAMVNVPFEWAKIVPIVVEMSVGDDWSSLHEVGSYSSDTWKSK